jgi:hypothetical protein
MNSPVLPPLLSAASARPDRPSLELWERWLLVALPAAWRLLLGLYGVRVALHGRYRVAALERSSTSGLLPRFMLEFGYCHRWSRRGSSRTARTRATTWRSPCWR